MRHLRHEIGLRSVLELVPSMGCGAGWHDLTIMAGVIGLGKGWDVTPTWQQVVLGVV